MHFPARLASISFLSIFGHKIGILKSPALFQGKELQVTRLKVSNRYCETVYHPNPGRVGSLTISKHHYKGGTISSVI